ncbi:ornithine cyclodeaminase family protein [Rhizobium sp. TRM96647]|uniref:ornithine cyclodeaminase family protein n=1 Tax=unclassified Rhizobium TaxID=2613769 RepID=UPI0021E828BC|nr:MULTISPECIES: ornithine cyclodeaminase family protein [unclassified Rhizobium]MCV3735146.1 ornithine cyclodeaminase family protein [Rhizobium sp. TRM96647]MCV3757516.1 ornithine cyclodeaminase family protein [Rhizobium sp. TRM96650]
MLVLTEQQTRDALPFADLIDALAEMFAGDCVMPIRHHHDVAVPGEENATLLLMPAWQPGAYIGVKLVSVFPGNTRRGLPAIFGSYLLSSGKTGELLAIIDGGELTARRTAAASALAARHLARADAKRLLVIGAGRLSLNLVAAHSAVRPIEEIAIWGRDAAKAEAAAGEARAAGFNARAVTDLEWAAREADIISCCTLSETPLVRGAWLRPGTHLDLIGAFKPSMRETDDEAVTRATLFVDTRDGALSEGGDLVQPIRAGIIGPEAIRADLAELVTGRDPGRRSPEEITLFKSVGAALEDLAGAILACRNHGA